MGWDLQLFYAGGGKKFFPNVQFGENLLSFIEREVSRPNSQIVSIRLRKRRENQRSAEHDG